MHNRTHSITSTAILSIALLLLTSACQAPAFLRAELPDDGPPIAVSRQSAARFVEKAVAAGKSAARGSLSTLTLTQEEVTSFLSISAQLHRMQNVQDPEQVEELGDIQDVEALRAFKEKMDRSDVNLPDLSLRVTIHEPQVYFKANGHIVLRGYGEIRNRRQPLRIVVAPRAAQGELVLDFVEGKVGPLPVPEALFDQVGKGLAQVIVAGQSFAEITEIRVSEGTITLSGRHNVELG